MTLNECFKYVVERTKKATRISKDLNVMQRLAVHAKKLQSNENPRLKALRNRLYKTGNITIKDWIEIEQRYTNK